MRLTFVKSVHYKESVAAHAARFAAEPMKPKTVLITKLVISEFANGENNEQLQNTQ